jgi:NADH:ubiquinone oxidoreductase subunit 6 (subunit J)
MMLESKLTDLSRSVMRYVPIGLIFAVVLLFPQLREISSNFDKNMYYDLFYQNSFQNWYDLVDSTTDVEVYGQVLYSYFVLQLLIAGLILLLVLIGVVYLTNNFNVSKQTRDQATFKQLARTTKFFYK